MEQVVVGCELQNAWIVLSPCPLPVAAHVPFLLLPTAFFCRFFHIFWHFLLPGVSIVSLPSPLQINALPPQGSVCKGPNPSTHCLASRKFLWYMGRSLHDPVALTFCMLTKLALFATRSSISRSLLGCGPTTGFWVPGWLNVGKHIHRRYCATGSSGALLLKQVF